MKFQIFFAWFDLWVGAYWDAGHHTLYICLIPTIVMRFEFNGTKRESKHRTDRPSEWTEVGVKWPKPESSPQSEEVEGVELLPCPFCGEKPALTNVRMSDHTFRVGCYNETCGVRPATDYYGSREQPSTAQEVIAAWGTRADNSSATQPEALLRSLIPRLCDFCRQGKAITKWGQRKNDTLSFTHWTGFDHAHCGAGSVHKWLDAEPSATQNQESGEPKPKAPSLSTPRIPKDIQAVVAERDALRLAVEEWYRLDCLKGLDAALRKKMKAHAGRLTRAAAHIRNCAELGGDPLPITQATVSPQADNSTTVPDHSPASDTKRFRL